MATSQPELTLTVPSLLFVGVFVRELTMNLTHVMTFVAGFQCFLQSSNRPLRLAWNYFAERPHSAWIGVVLAKSAADPCKD